MRKHHQFPTQEEVKENPDLAYSDHLMLLTKIPMGQDRKPLNIISLNILEDVTNSGIHPEHFPDKEDEQKYELERYERIAEGLKNGVDANGVDIILLQGINKAETIKEPLQKKFGDDWEVSTKTYGLYIFYNTKRLNPQSDSTQNVVRLVARIRSMTFLDNQNDAMSLDIHNLLGNFYAFPLSLETACKNALENTKSKISVIFGNTNSKVAPLDDRPRTIITSLVPVTLDSHLNLTSNAQLTDFPDGGYYRDEENKIHQLVTEVLDFKKGTVVENGHDENGENVSNEYQMVMCLDETYQSKKVINEQTIFEYEESLKHTLGIPDIMVRIGSDSFNNKAIGIRFPTNSLIFPFIKEKLKDNIGIQYKKIETFEKSNETYDCVFVPLDRQESLHNVIVEYKQYEQDEIVKNLKNLTSDCFKEIGRFRSAYKILKNLNNIIEDNTISSGNKIIRFYAYLEENTNGKKNSDILREDKSKAVVRFIAGVISIAAIILPLPIGLAVMGVIYTISKKQGFDAKLPHHLFKPHKKGKIFVERSEKLKPRPPAQPVFFGTIPKEEEQTQKKNANEVNP